MPPVPSLGGNPFNEGPQRVWGQYQDPTATNFPSFLSPESQKVMNPSMPKAPTAAQGSTTDDYYKYAILASLLGSAGAGIGQAFQPWVKPPQPLPSPQAPQMPITAPAVLQALTQTRAARKGYKHRRG